MNKKYNYIEKGEGEAVILLHGLMGAVSNFESTLEKLPKFGYRVILPMLPLYSLPVLKTNVNKLALRPLNWSLENAYAASVPRKTLKNAAIKATL